MRSRNNHARARALVAIATAVAFVLGACSKGEPEKAPIRPAAPAAVSTAPADASPAAGNYAPGEALKERLARQAAADAMLNAPPPPAAPARPAQQPQQAAPAKAPELAKAAPAPSSPPKAVEPVAVATPAPPPPPAATVKAEPPKVTPPPAPRTEVAVAKPQPAPVATRLVQRVEPEFPREALQAGEEKGVVQARLTLDERGNVTQVEVVEARPRRLFDRAVVRALSQWKYNDGAGGRTVEVEVAFQR
jgi:protein TonB